MMPAAKPAPAPRSSRLLPSLAGARNLLTVRSVFPPADLSPLIRMKKFFLILLALLAVAAVAAYFFLGALIGRGVVAGVNTFGPRLTGTPVNLAAARISPLGGHGTLTDLVVGNPEGYRSEKAFSFGAIEVKVKPRTLLGDPIVVEEVVIRGPEFVYETRLTSSNLGTILDHINTVVGATGRTSLAADEPERRFAIKRLVVEDARVSVAALGAGATAPVPRLEILDLGSEERGVTGGEAAAIVLRRVLDAVVRSALDAGARRGLDLGGAAEKAGEAVRGLLDRVAPRN
jgi:hypothetical protein